MDSPSLFDQQQHTARPSQTKTVGLTPVRIAIVLAVGGAFLGILIYALLMREDIRTTEVDIPLISAPETAVKRRPDAPGGLEFANRDKLVFNLLDENIQSEAALDEVALPSVQAVPVSPKPTPVAVAQPQNVTPQAKQITESVPNETPQTVTDIIQKEAQPAPKPTQPPATPALTKPNNSGSYGVQLASFVTQKDAERALVTFLKTHKSLLGPLTGEVQSKDIGQGRGLRYRARFIGLENRSSANQLCTALKAKNQGCLVVKR